MIETGSSGVAKFCIENILNDELGHKLINLRGSYQKQLCFFTLKYILSCHY